MSGKEEIVIRDPESSLVDILKKEPLEQMLQRLFWAE